MTLKIEEATLRRLWPRGDSKIPGLIAGIASTSEDVFRRRGMTTWLQVAHIMAQISLECGAGTEVVEDLSYTAKRMMEVWPSRFPTLASALPYQRNPRKLGNKVYGGRMGNRPGTDDGFDMRGRGGTQTTGRDGYERLGTADDPDRVNDPQLFLDFAVADFIACGCLPFCSPRAGLPLGDIDAVTHHLNGGYTGLADRKVWFKRWCDALDLMAKIGQAPAHTFATDRVLRYGQHDNPVIEVKAVQDALIAKGYRAGKVDGAFGAETRRAVLGFQADNGLATTGEVDDATKRALETAPPAPVSEDRESTDAADLRAAGSETIGTADTIKKIGWGAVGLVGGGKSLDASGALDKAQGLVDQASSFRGIVDSVSDLSQWAASHWWIGAIAAGAGLIFFAERIIARRVADHRSGANMSR